MLRKSIAVVVILLFFLSSLIPLVSSNNPNLNKTIYVDDDNTFYDYTDDVFCIYYESIFDNGMFRNDEKQNVNIISGSYSINDDNVTLILEVEGIIEDRGDVSDFNNSIFYAFYLNTSINNYMINYCNGCCVLIYDNITKYLSNFLVDVSNLSVIFSLNNTSETFNYVQILAFDTIIDYDTFKNVINFDYATHIEYSMDIEITKPDNSLYVFNREILPLSSPVIIGTIYIEFEELLDETWMVFNELYIDGVLTENLLFNNFNNFIIWKKLSFGKHTLKVIAFDQYGNRASDEMIVWKFF